MALQADAWHLRTDVWTSAGVMVGLGLIWLVEKVWANAHFHWLDPMAAMVVALLIVHAAYDLTRGAIQDLMDQSLTEDEMKQIRTAILSYSRQICGFHRLRTRKSGPSRFVEFHLLVEGSMTVSASHNLTDLITAKIEEFLPQAAITIHIEPCNGYCSEVCRQGCLLDMAEQRQRHHQHLQFVKSKTEKPA